MNTKDVTAEYRLAHWTQVIQERVEKGLSIREYCENVGIHENTYFYWQRKLREAACSGVQVAAALVPGEKSLAPNGWASLCVSYKPSQPQGLTVEVGGCRITVLPDTDLGLLTKVCQALITL